MGFDDPTRKMSKSIAKTHAGHAVSLLDTPKRIKKTIMGAKTDTGCEFRAEHASPGIRNLISIHQALSEESYDTIANRYDGRGYGYLKKDLLELVMESITPIQAEFARYQDDPAMLDAVLKASTDKARSIAATTMDRVRHAVGIG